MPLTGRKSCVTNLALHAEIVDVLVDVPVRAHDVTIWPPLVENWTRVPAGTGLPALSATWTCTSVSSPSMDQFNAYFLTEIDMKRWFGSPVLTFEMPPP